MLGCSSHFALIRRRYPPVEPSCSNTCLLLLCLLLYLLLLCLLLPSMLPVSAGPALWAFADFHGQRQFQLYF
jgi:hypothetical protein